MKSWFVIAALVISTLTLGQNTAPLGTITARVTDESKNPIPGVTVSAYGPSGLIITGLTDQRGSVVLRVAPGTNGVTASLQGFLSQSVQVTVKSSEDAPLALTLRIAPQALPPSPFDRDRDVDLQADAVTTQGNTVLYRGNVRMKTESVEVHADAIDYNTVTRTANARGNVTIQVLPIRPRVTPLSQRRPD
jgi:Carboxypeptidase regulatory-like domain